MKNKILALVLSAAMLLPLSGCGKSAPDGEVTNNIPENKDLVVAYVGGDPLTKEEYLYYLRNRLSSIAPYLSLESYESYLDEPVDGIPAAEYIKNTALDDAKQLRIIEEKYKALGYDFDKKSGADYKTAMQSTIDYFGGEKEFQNVLMEDGISVETYERRQKAMVMANVVALEYFQNEGAPYGVTEDEVRAVYDTSYTRVKHILLKTVDDSRAPLPDDVKEEKKALAEELYERVLSGADFEALIEEYGEDPGMESYVDGYVFTFGKMDAPFETAAFSLKPGEVSEIVEGAWGYHIIKCYPLDEEKFYTQVKDEIKETLLSDNTQKAMTEWLAEMQIETVEEELGKEDLSPYTLLKKYIELIEEQNAVIEGSTNGGGTDEDGGTK